MPLRKDAILLCGFIYGANSSIPKPVRDAMHRIYSVEPEAPPPTPHQRLVQDLDTSADSMQNTDKIEHEEKLPPSILKTAHEENGEASPPPPPEDPAPPKPKRVCNWSAEQRAAQSQRMKDRQANGGLRKKPQHEAIAEEATATPPAKPFTEVSADKLISDHNETLGQAIPRVLVKADWTNDIRFRHMTLNHSNTSIAGDYGVTEKEMDTFIRQQKHREKTEQEETDRGNA